MLVTARALRGGLSILESQLQSCWRGPSEERCPFSSDHSGPIGLRSFGAHHWKPVFNSRTGLIYELLIGISHSPLMSFSKAFIELPGNCEVRPTTGNLMKFWVLGTLRQATLVSLGWGQPGGGVAEASGSSQPQCTRLLCQHPNTTCPSPLIATPQTHVPS